MVNGQKVTKLLGQKVTIYMFYPGVQKVTGQKVTIYIFYPGGQKVTTYIFA
jgi:ABC-type Zn uptake system ZnuABC Zn-binding protein ZnuA